MKLKQMKPVNKVVLAYSGGLDSALCIRLLEDYYSVKEIMPVLVDVGQGSKEIGEALEKLNKLGLTGTVLDAKSRYVHEWVGKAIKANGLYGEYPISSSMTRQLIASELVGFALKEKCEAVVEGSSGKGNDQFRFHHVFKLLAPELGVIAPVRDFNLSRTDERKLADKYKIPYYPGISDDKTMWGRSIGSGEVGNLTDQIPDSEYLWWTPPHEAPDTPAILEVEFKKGIPVRVNDVEGLENIIGLLNEVAGKNSIGRIDTIEDGILGLKSRELYETPAASLVLALHKDLERLCLTKEELDFKAMVDVRWGSMIYHGKWFHPLKESLDAFIDHSQQVVNGTLKVSICKGYIRILERHSQFGLYSSEIRSLEVDSFDQRRASAAVDMLGMENAVLNARNIRSNS
ncbi:MAG: argininosuccinate synthase [bacterium]|nr:argininosuccinate synthase [bacterium]